MAMSRVMPGEIHDIYGKRIIAREQGVGLIIDERVVSCAE